MATAQNAGDLIPTSANPHADPPLQPFQQVILDGRTLEGGGQLVRIAVALSAITGRPVSIDYIRGKRSGKRGLKASHVAAVKLLGEISRSRVLGGHVGSESLKFEPQPLAKNDTTLLGMPRSVEDIREDAVLVPLANLSVRSEYTIRLGTPGSVFLVFQTLYPYLLYVGSQAPAECIKVTVTGGTNTSRAPSYDYASQVMAPNFARLGLPLLDITLNSRGWEWGPIELGTVCFLVHPLPIAHDNNDHPRQRTKNLGSDARARITTPCFPRIDMMDQNCGKVTQVDLTILASDRQLPGRSTPLRKFVEGQTRSALRKKLAILSPQVFDSIMSEDGDSPVPIELHTSEPTAHINRLYILLVAHISTGFRVGHDALLGMDSWRRPPKRGPKLKKGQQLSPMPKLEIDIDRITNLIESCVDGFGNTLQKTVGAHMAKHANGAFGCPPWLDEHMRDQIVIFEALGNLRGHNADDSDKRPEVQEDKENWTLHTHTAQWVCQEILGKVPRRV
ncbi:uncharacterized protein N7459_007963 [Penicillium hispanicum]|uniref:uncharacterized protein n=1 Tax=Penicillium hispanicum TaxID=1080232 RepID=UPI002541DA9F|nr:uncharacterized protein N7459_007963 [Penicillium hispanicum]KAJ5573536.1 hypothetical protein N7459_007963 [Penicillium hispanicum]